MIYCSDCRKENKLPSTNDNLGFKATCQVCGEVVQGAFAAPDEVVNAKLAKLGKTVVSSTTVTTTTTEVVEEVEDEEDDDADTDTQDTQDHITLVNDPNGDIQQDGADAVRDESTSEEIQSSVTDSGATVDEVAAPGVQARSEGNQRAHRVTDRPSNSGTRTVTGREKTRLK